MLELMGNTRDAKFNSSTLILARSKKSDGFLKSYSKVARKWYNSDVIAASSNPGNQLEIVNEWVNLHYLSEASYSLDRLIIWRSYERWFSEKTGGRQRPFGALLNSLTDSLEFNVVSFESCWNKFKMVSAEKSVSAYGFYTFLWKWWTRFKAYLYFMNFFVRRYLIC